MLYISLYAMLIKKLNNYNKSWLKHNEYAKSDFRSF